MISLKCHVNQLIQEQWTQKTFIVKAVGETRQNQCEDVQMTVDQQVIWGLLVAVSFLLLVLSMGDDVTQVLVIQVSSNIQGKVCEHLVYLKGREIESESEVWFMVMEIKDAALKWTVLFQPSVILHFGADSLWFGIQFHSYVPVHTSRYHF